MSFQSIMADIGQGVGNFIGPTSNALGSNTTQSTTTTTKASSSNTIIIISVIVVIVIVGYFLFRGKTKQKPGGIPAPIPQT